MTSSRLAAIALYLALAVLPQAARASRLVEVHVPSALLSHFWGSPITLDAKVLLPDSYAANGQQRFPVVYWLHAFGDTPGRAARRFRGGWDAAFTKTGKPAIVVFPNPMFRTLYTEFADSVNLGPWGEAFTTELVPFIDTHFRTDGRRMLAGHSSGGWSCLWLQVEYSALFDGAWCYAPDPIDFQDFTGPNLTLAAPGNFFQRRRGDPYMSYRVRGQMRDSQTLRDLLYSMPAQVATWDAVFSPRASNGLPAHLFDYRTGAIDPHVAHYWERHYDITRLIVAHWPQLAPSLNGKIHVIVGADDTYHLEGPVRLFARAMQRLGACVDVRIPAQRDHWSILTWDGGFQQQIAREMLKNGACASTAFVRRFSRAPAF